MEINEETNLKKEARSEIKNHPWPLAQCGLSNVATGRSNSNSSVKCYGNFYSDSQGTFTENAFLMQIRIIKDLFW